MMIRGPGTDGDTIISPSLPSPYTQCTQGNTVVSPDLSRDQSAGEMRTNNSSCQPFHRSGEADGQTEHCIDSIRDNDLLTNELRNYILGFGGFVAEKKQTLKRDRTHIPKRKHN